MGVSNTAQTTSGAPGHFALFQQRFKKFAHDSSSSRMIGFMLCRAWVYVSLFNSAALVFTGNPAGTLRFVYMASLVVLILNHLVIGLLDRRMEAFYMSRVGRILPAALTTLGTIALIFADIATTPGMVLCITSAVLTGVGSSLILVFWGRVYATVGGPTTAGECSLAHLLGTLLVPIYVALPVGAEVIISSALPIVSAVMVAREFKGLSHGFYLTAHERGKAKGSEGAKTKVAKATKAAKEAKVAAKEPDSPVFATNNRQADDMNFARKLLVKLSLSSIVFGSTIGIVRMLYTNSSVSGIITSFVLPVAGLIATVMVLGILLCTRRLDLAFTYRPVMILLCVSLLILPLIDEVYYITYILTMSGYFCFEVLNWVMLADISYRNSLSAYRVVSFGRAAVSGGVLLGDIIGLVLLRFPAGTPTELLYGISLGLVFLLIITYTLTLTERDVARATRTEPRAFRLPESALHEGGEDEVEASGDAPEAAGPLTIDDKIQLLALRNDITGRAFDVLALMAKGRTAARIEQELYISRGTVNTYSHKIYQKLDIHSRQELFDLVDAVQE